MPRGSNLVDVMQSLAEIVVKNAGPPTGGSLCQHADGHATGHADFVSAEFCLEKSEAQAQRLHQVPSRSSPATFV
jgi:hypothetical protein